MEIPFARFIIMMFIFIYSMLQIPLFKSFVMLPLKIESLSIYRQRKLEDIHPFKNQGSFLLAGME